MKRTTVGTIAEFMRLAREAGHDSLGIANDPEAIALLDSLKPRMPCMDNFKVDVIARDSSLLALAVTMLMSEHTTIVATRDNPDLKPRKLALYWHADRTQIGNDKEFSILPYGFKLEQTLALIEGWMQQLKDDDYGKRPGIDGSVSRGYHIHNNERYLRMTYVAFEIEPVWAMHHK